ncbi:Outer membrane protein beta-barrel domain-containing protein [Mesonia phycicola]|uniref:Outer membrane protein beta-barrel domain-containing protein n=1 Tax=Mesonia phycicola TaxID=579105 RepID=A0A1M6EL12_9FLAO|nr:outer membrane beta-barrel protein [Mesonia phycicola]SHI86134.1 Outer membrane protein beta-barrel domain-containing protein [Mesonia phycicola]
MKKLLLLVAFTCFISISSYSQFYGSFCYDCYTSIEVGGISSNISGLDKSSAKTGFYLGFLVYTEISDSFAIRTGTTYNSLGAHIEGYDEPLQLHSINFPLGLNYIKDYKYQAFVGGELGTNYFGTDPRLENADSFYDSFEIQDNITLFDASIYFGVGYIIADNIDINLKYNLGVTNISKYPEQNLKKNWLTLSAAYTFRY